MGADEELLLLQNQGVSLGSQPRFVPRTSTWAPRDTPSRATSGCVSLSFQFRTEKANTHIHKCTKLDPLNPQSNRPESEHPASGLKKEKSNNLWMQTKLNHNVSPTSMPNSLQLLQKPSHPIFLVLTSMPMLSSTSPATLGTYVSHPAVLFCHPPTQKA